MECRKPQSKTYQTNISPNKYNIICISVVRLRVCLSSSFPLSLCVRNTHLPVVRSPALCDRQEMSKTIFFEARLRNGCFVGGTVDNLDFFLRNLIIIVIWADDVTSFRLISDRPALFPSALRSEIVIRKLVQFRCTPFWTTINLFAGFTDQTLLY